jgi:hypothetical protein
MLADLGLWEELRSLFDSTSRYGTLPSLNALGRATERYLSGSGQQQRLDTLRRDFPAAFGGADRPDPDPRP